MPKMPSMPKLSSFKSFFERDKMKSRLNLERKARNSSVHIDGQEFVENLVRKSNTKQWDDIGHGKYGTLSYKKMKAM